MADQTKIVVSRTIDATAKEIFDILTLPQRHKEFDGSGTVVSDERSQRIQGVGDEFTMNMNAEARGGDFKMENRVHAFAENKMVGWVQAPEGGEPGGWTWTYELKAEGPDSTEVTLTYDWSGVEDKRLASQQPTVSKDALEHSLGLLAAAVA